MIDRLLQPLLSLHGWPAYALVGVLVFAEAAVMLGFVFPGETASILGGVLASKGGVNLEGILVVVVVFSIRRRRREKAEMEGPQGDDMGDDVEIAPVDGGGGDDADPA